MIELDIIQEWCRFAGDDLFIAKHVINDLYPPKLEIACYHSQQASEKALKGYLIYKTHDDPKRTHDLKFLCKECIKIDDSFNKILGYCDNLTDFVTSGRYPEEVPVDEAIARAAVAKADAVYSFCLSKIPELQELAASAQSPSQA